MVLAAVHTVETLDLNYAVLAEDYIRHSASLADNVVAVVAVVLHTEVVAERLSSQDTADTSSHQHHRHLLVVVIADSLASSSSSLAALDSGIDCSAIFLPLLGERAENSVVVKVVDSSMITSMAGVAEGQAEDKKKTVVVVVLLETQSMKAGAVHRSVMVEEASHLNARAEVPAGARAKESYLVVASLEEQRDAIQQVQKEERYVVVVAVGTLHSSAVGPVDDTEKVVVDSSANRRSSSSCPFVSLERFKSILSRTLKTPPPRTRGFHLSTPRRTKARDKTAAASGRVAFSPFAAFCPWWPESLSSLIVSKGGGTNFSTEQTELNCVFFVSSFLSSFLPFVPSFQNCLNAKVFLHKPPSSSSFVFFWTCCCCCCCCCCCFLLLLLVVSLTRGGDLTF